MVKNEYVESAILDLWKSHSDFSNIFEYLCETPEEEFDQEVAANLVLGALEFMNVRLNTLLRVQDETSTEYDTDLEAFCSLCYGRF